MSHFGGVGGGGTPILAVRGNRALVFLMTFDLRLAGFGFSPGRPLGPRAYGLRNAPGCSELIKQSSE